MRIPTAIRSKKRKNTHLSKIGRRKISKKNGRAGLVRKRKRKPLKRGLKVFLIVYSGFLIFCVFGFLIYGGFYLKNLEKSLPEPNKLVERKSDQTTIIFDRNGHELFKIYADQNRKFVKIDDLPEHLKWAVLSAEDIGFYDHGGFDLSAITKSAYINFVTGEILRGASTITQQLVRNTILYDVFGTDAYEETYSRKLKEILLTIQVEQILTKDEILQMYLNEVGFGGVHHGIQAASVAYFGKDARDLTLAESAMLAGTIASPSNYSPIYSSSFELPTRRQYAVLDLMLKNKHLTGVNEEEIEAAKEERIEYASTRIEIKAPHFVFYVRSQLEEMYGKDFVQKGGLNVKTTLDLEIQEIAEEEVLLGIEKYGHKWNVHNGAMIVIEPNTNQIIAMVGSVDYWENKNPKIDGNVNVTLMPRQMGSSVKPYTYLAAFQRGYSPKTIVPDRPGLNFGDYRVKNWDGKYFGNITARQALIQSRNVSAVYVLKSIGVDSFIKTAEKLGITTLDSSRYYGLSLTLGTAEMTLLEHTAAFSVFANEGIKKPVVSILEITDPSENVIYKNYVVEGRRVFDEKYIKNINWILCDLGDFEDQPQHHLYVIDDKRVLCGKTGTTDGPKDLVSIMYHRNLLIGVWAGNNNNIVVPGAWSTTVPLPISHSFMKRVADIYKPEGF